MQSVLEISINNSSMLNEAITELQNKPKMKKTNRIIETLKAFLIKLNLFTWYRKLRIYIRLFKLARNECKVMRKAQKDLSRKSTSSQDYANQLNRYKGLALQWHYGYKFISTWISSDGRTTFRISKPKIHLEVDRVYLDEMKKLA